MSRNYPSPDVGHVDDLHFAVDAGWRFTHCNGRAAAVFERPREDLLGRVVWDVLPHAIENQFPDGFYESMTDRTAVSFDVYHTTFETWFETRAFPFDDGLAVYMRDVTHRKEREAKLAQHDAVVEATRDGIVILDRHNHVASINSTLERTLGVEREAVIGEHIETVFDLAAIDADDAVEIGHAINDIDLGRARYRELEVPFTDANGTERVSEVRLVPIDEGEAKLASIVRDVTERHDHERIVTSLHEVTRWLLGSNDREEICAIAVHAGSDLLDLPISGIWLLDDEHGSLDPVAGTAGAHDEFGGLPRFSQGEGLVWDVFESGESRLYDDLHDVDGLYNPETTIRSEIIAPIGTHGVLITGSKEPKRFDETDLELVSTLVENTRAALDRTDRERVLEERTERLERQTERLEAVATVLSKDLTRELETIADALETDETPADEWEFPLAEEGVERTLERTERLVDDVREFARNASGVGLRTLIDLETAVEAAVEASRIDESTVIVEESATLRADPERFSRMLETVFDDAAARAERAVTVQVGLLGFETPGVATSQRGFFLLDDASEIPPNAHDRVLDPAADVGGDIDGLGLAVARAIADAHGWQVSVANGENGGTRFEVTDVTTLERR
ncbi:PAS domain-containing protein [Natronobiforma cellulositropha]|uniref:PAS domain-containing protein n=1 Tax=Natronobiforma cellulositropha TaxID=1679076 RepID=UPI0021D5D920|nr:PAS domain-containing protein [Natronobiforma cellulositropha]